MTGRQKREVTDRRPEVRGQASNSRASTAECGERDNATLTKIEFATTLVLCLIIVVLHFVVLRHAGGMWRDEINTIGVAQAGSLAEFWQLLCIATFPIPYFGLLRFWIELTGSGDTALRILVFLVGISIPLALWINATLLRPAHAETPKSDPLSRFQLFRISAFWSRGSFPLLSLAVFGLNADAIWHADMIRGYGLAIIFTSLAVGLVWRLVVAPSRAAFLLATLAAIGTTQCLFQNAFFVMAICLAGTAVAARLRLWKRAGLILSVGGIAAACMVPYVPLILKSGSSHAVDAGSLVVGDAITVGLRTLNSSGNYMAVVLAAMFALAVGAAAVAQFPAVWRVPTEKRDLAFYVVIASVVGVAGFILFFFSIAKFAMAARYYIVPLGFVAVCLDGIVSVLPVARWRRVIVLCISISIALASLPKAWTQAHVRHTNLDRIAARLDASAAKEDLVVVMPCMYGATFNRYYNGAAPWITLPEIADFQIQRDDLWKEKLATTNATASALGKIGQALKSGKTVWFVGEPVFLPEGQRPPTLPPAPHGPRGWYYGPYEEMWAREAGYFLQSHTERFKVVIPRGTDVNPDENLPLMVFEGWRSSEIAPR